MRIGIIIITLIHCIQGLNRLEVVYQWKSVDFAYPNERSRNESIRKREFIPGNAVPLDVDVWNNGRERKVFVTFPKFNDGIPVTLATVTDTKRDDSYMLEPYPDWSWHSQGKCDGLTSVFRTQIDNCGRLWVIDSGMINLSIEGRRLCQPQLVRFDLTTNKLSGRFRFPNDLLKDESILANLAVDIRTDNCDGAFVYVADVTSYALLVFDATNMKAWKVQSNTMYPYPPYGVFTANNAEFDLMDGILGMALTPVVRGDRDLYYHSLASIRESWVPTSVLRNESNFDSGENKMPRMFEMSQEARKSQSIAEAFDKNGILYFGMMNDNSINCWNSETSYKASNIHQLEKDDYTLQFPSGMKIIENRQGEEELWVITDRFQLLMTGKMKPNAVNFRIMTGKVEDLLRNSPCKKYKAIVFPDKVPYTHSPHTEKYPKPSSGYYG